jgi:hypothetical protein
MSAPGASLTLALGSLSRFPSSTLSLPGYVRFNSQFLAFALKLGDLHLFDITDIFGRTRSAPDHI